MKKLNKLKVLAVVLLIASVFTGCSVYSTIPAGVQTSYDNPPWAPPYYEGARYYYIPDIECYYDLSTRDFIYLRHGQWSYSQNIYSIYPDFDLNNCFSIVLNVNVYRPWMHHQYYVSHYPRYYYRDYYDHSNIPYVRGFNENGRRAVYWRENERNRARNWDNRNMENNRKFKYSKEDRKQQKDWNNPDNDRQPSRNQDNFDRNQENRDRNIDTRDRNTDTRTNPDNARTRQQQEDNRKSTRSTDTKSSTRQQSTTPEKTERSNDTNYYGKTIGKPVKVEKQMQERSVKKSTGRR